MGDTEDVFDCWWSSASLRPSFDSLELGRRGGLGQTQRTQGPEDGRMVGRDSLFTDFLYVFHFWSMTYSNFDLMGNNAKCCRHSSSILMIILSRRFFAILWDSRTFSKIHFSELCRNLRNMKRYRPHEFVAQDFSESHFKLLPSCSFFHWDPMQSELFFEKLCAEESEIQPLNATRIATPNGRIKNIIATEAQWSGQKDNGAWERPWRHWSEGAPDGRSIEYHPIIDW